MAWVFLQAFARQIRSAGVGNTTIVERSSPCNFRGHRRGELSTASRYMFCGLSIMLGSCWTAWLSISEVHTATAPGGASPGLAGRTTIFHSYQGPLDNSQTRLTLVPLGTLSLLNGRARRDYAATSQPHPTMQLAAQTLQTVSAPRATVNKAMPSCIVAPRVGARRPQLARQTPAFAQVRRALDLWTMPCN